MSTRIFIPLLAILSFVATAAADEGRRFPQDHITVEDWNTYFTEVKALPGTTIRESDQQTTIADPKTNTIYAFTTAKNPAHPGVVVRRAVRAKEGVALNRVGYYAGDANAFLGWWHAFDALDEKVKAELNAANAPRPQVDPADVQVRKNANGTFNLILTSKAVSNLNDAQIALLPKAVEVCQGKRPALGVYKLDKLEKVPGRTSTAGEIAALKLDQEIICQ